VVPPSQWFRRFESRARPVSWPLPKRRHYFGYPPLADAAPLSLDERGDKCLMPVATFLDPADPLASR
jgi:hypothetical protein